MPIHELTNVEIDAHLRPMGRFVAPTRSKDEVDASCRGKATVVNMEDSDKGGGTHVITSHTSHLMMTELFVVVHNHPLYAITSTGRVLRISTGGYVKPIRGACYNKYWLDEERLNVHRLVADHFLPNPQHHPHVDHIDSNTFNNVVSNLRWVSLSTSQLHRRKQQGTGRNWRSMFKGVSRRIYPSGRVLWITRFRGRCYYGNANERAAAEQYNRIALAYDPASTVNVFD